MAGVQGIMQLGGRFRETLWFKLGALPDPPAGDDDGPSARERPVEDRYLDDGSLSRADSETFGMHTGRTDWLVPLRDGPVAASGSPELGVLVREMKRVPRRLLVAVAASAVAIAAVVVLQVVA